MRIVSKLDALKHDVDEHQIPIPRIIPFSEDAKHLFFQWWKKLPDVKPVLGRMGGWWGKAPGLCKRIALVLEYIEWALAPDGPEPSEASPETIQKAIHFMESYAGPMAERAHGVASKSGGEADTRTLALHIQGSGFSEFSARDLQRSGPMRNLTAKEIKAACFDLVGHGWLVAAPVRQGTTAGKNKDRFMVNPAL